MLKKLKKSLVFVGLSGGVDSSVSAAILKQAANPKIYRQIFGRPIPKGFRGFDVRGVFIKVWQPHFAEAASRGKPVCTAKVDRLDAMRVCAKLDIPFYTLDLEKEYKKEVVDYMIAEYKAGRTPNPDVMCNKYVKFGGFFDWAMKNGADYVATGHYARTVTMPEGKTKPSSDTDIFLLKNSSCSRQSRSQAPHKTSSCLLAGADKNKDQSYFLWTLTQKQLSKTLFPVGNLEKSEVRKLAKKFGLETAVKKDSQGLCFIGKVEMAEFLKHFIKTKPGKVLNESGEIIGKHDGVELYTIGQRHGFEITKKTNSDERYFIISKDSKSNTMIVSHNPVETQEISSREIELKNINWTIGSAPDLKKDYSARIRYRQLLEKCHLKYEGGIWIVTFTKSQKAVTPGQSVVIYDGEICLGGGIIK